MFINFALVDFDLMHPVVALGAAHDVLLSQTAFSQSYGRPANAGLPPAAREIRVWGSPPTYVLSTCKFLLLLEVLNNVLARHYLLWNSH